MGEDRPAVPGFPEGQDAGGAVAGLVVAYVAMNGYDGLYEDLIKHLKGLAGGGNG